MNEKKPIIIEAYGEKYPCKPDIFEKTYGYDEHSNTFVFDGQSFTFTLEDMVVIKLIKTKKPDLHMISMCELHTYNHNYPSSPLTEAEFTAIKSWLCA